MSKKKLKPAANSVAWAVGWSGGDDFHIRRVVWGLLHAEHERRDYEEIRAAKIMVEATFKKRKSVIAKPLHENEGQPVTS